MTANEKIETGDFMTIRWKDSNHCGYAFGLLYKGRNKKKGYVFESTIYGWNYIVDCKKETVTVCGYSMEKTFPVDNRSGWLRYLPD